MKRRILALLTALLLALLAFAAAAETVYDNGSVIVDTRDWTAMSDDAFVEYGKSYSAPDEVALYLHCFEELPGNFITKKDAQNRGWNSRSGNLWKVADGCSIGGDRFYNREEKIPEIVGIKCWECDVNFDGGFRQAERLIFSEDGRIYYTDDHYQTFTMLYDGWFFEDGTYRGIGGK